MRDKFFGLTALASAAMLLGACAESTDGQAASGRPPARSIPVIAEPLTFDYARTEIESVGTSRAILSADLYPAASGEVVAVNLEPGQLVEKGDVLVELDSREEKLAVRLATLKLEDAERLYDRYERSADSGAVLPTTVDSARTAVELARVELESAKIALQDRRIRAVFDGHVGSTDVDPGDRIGPDSLVTTLDDRSALLVSFDIPEQFIGALSVGDSIELETWSAVPAVTGEIVDIGSRISQTNRSFVARARVSNDDDTLRPGMSFRVSAGVTGPRYASVAETALQWGADGAYLWAVVDSAAVRTPVQVIQRRDGRVLVDGEFAAELLVVVEGTQSVREGAAVEVDEEHLAEVRQ
ncbi:MAG: efflux RND transporter periplasmic adaptor subunit [Woeseiaceae bacterium]